MAADPIEAVIEQLSTIQERLDGIAQSYRYSPEAITAVPCFINYIIRGQDQRVEASSIKSLYTFGSELYVARGVLTQAEAQARPYIIKYADAIWLDPTLNGTVTTVVAVRHAFRVFKYAGSLYVGVRFEIDAKMLRAVVI